MSGSGSGEIYFVVAMIIFSLIVSGISTYVFIRQYRREKAERELRKKEKTDYVKK
jgi:NhaP-type Na+/H+ or K+/H+ antiporter